MVGVECRENPRTQDDANPRPEAGCKAIRQGRFPVSDTTGGFYRRAAKRARLERIVRPLPTENEMQIDDIRIAALNHERDTPRAAKIKRQRLETGPQARRAKRKADGKPPLLQGKTKIESAGFRKDVTRGFDGKVRPR